jgi:hypothetical protein
MTPTVGADGVVGSVGVVEGSVIGSGRSSGLSSKEIRSTWPPPALSSTSGVAGSSGVAGDVLLAATNTRSPRRTARPAGAGTSTLVYVSRRVFTRTTLPSSSD